MQHPTLFNTQGGFPSSKILSPQQLFDGEAENPVFTTKANTKLPLTLYNKSKDCFKKDCSPASGDSTSLPLFGRTFLFLKSIGKDKREFLIENKEKLNACDPDSQKVKTQENKCYYGRKCLILSKVFGHVLGLESLRKERSFIDLRDDENPGNLIELLFSVIRLDFYKKYGRSIEEEEKSESQTYVCFSDEYDSHIGFVTSFYRVGEYDEPSKPSRFSNFILEWLTVNGVDGVVTSPDSNLNRYIREKFKPSKGYKHPPNYKKSDMYVTFTDPGKLFNFTMTSANESVFFLPDKDSPLFEGLSIPFERGYNLTVHFSDYTHYILWFFYVLKKNFITTGKTIFSEKETTVEIFIDSVLKKMSYYTSDPERYKLLENSPDFGTSEESFVSYKRDEDLQMADESFNFITRRLMGLDYKSDALLPTYPKGSPARIFNIVELVNSLSDNLSAINGHFDTTVTMLSMYEDLMSSYSFGNILKESFDVVDLVTQESSTLPPFETLQSSDIHNLIAILTSDDDLMDSLSGPDVIDKPKKEFVASPPFGISTILSGVLIYGKSKGERKDMRISSEEDFINTICGYSTKEERILNGKVVLSIGDDPSITITSEVDRAPRFIYPNFDPQKSMKMDGRNINSMLVARAAFPNSSHIISQLAMFSENKLNGCGYFSEDDASLTTPIITEITRDEKEKYTHLVGYKRERANHNLIDRAFQMRRKRANRSQSMLETTLRRMKYGNWIRWYKNKVDGNFDPKELFDFVYHNYDEEKDEIPVDKDFFSEMGFLAPEEAMAKNPSSPFTPKSYVDIDKILTKGISLIFGRLPVTSLDQEDLIYSSDITTRGYSYKNINVLQGPPSVHTKTDFAHTIWLDSWKNQNINLRMEDSGDVTLSDRIMADAYTSLSLVNPPEGEYREMSDQNISLYFHNVLGINETDEYAFVNLSEFEQRSYGYSFPGITDRHKLFRKIWSEISRHGNLSKIPRVKRERDPDFDIPEYFDKIHQGGWNGIRCIFIIARTSSSMSFIRSMLDESKKPSDNLHWVIMVLITGEMEGDVRQLRYYDSMMYPRSINSHTNNVLAQMALCGMISPESNLISFTGVNPIRSIENVSLIEKHDTSNYSTFGMAMYELETKDVDKNELIARVDVINSMISVASSYGALDTYTGNPIASIIQRELSDTQVITEDSGDKYELTESKISLFLVLASQLYDIPGSLFEGFPKSEGDDLIVTRPGPFLKNIILQKDSWECGYFSCALAKHIMTIGKVYVLPLPGGGTELSWCSETFGAGPKSYVIPLDASGSSLGLTLLRPRKEFVNETVIRKMDNPERYNRHTFFLHKLLYPVICNLSPRQSPWNDRYGDIVIPIISGYLREFEEASRLIVLGDLNEKHEAIETFGSTLYRITKMHSLAVIIDTMFQVYVYAAPDNYIKYRRYSIPESNETTPWFPRIVKHSYLPSVSDFTGKDVKLAVYSENGIAPSDQLSEAYNRRNMDFNIRPWELIGEESASGCDSIKG